MIVAYPHVERATAWSIGVARYQYLRDASDAMPLGTEGEDDAVEVYCHALDELIEHLRAPDAEAIIFKIDLIAAKDMVWPDEWINAIKADLRELADRGRS